MILFFELNKMKDDLMNLFFFNSVQFSRSFVSNSLRPHES